MPLDDPDVIDIITRPAPRKLELVIADAGRIADPQERLAKLIHKLRGYAAFAGSEEFRRQYPKVEDVSIVVVCKNPPTEEMIQIAKVTPGNEPERAIPVRFDVFDPDRDAPGSSTFINSAFAERRSVARLWAGRLLAILLLIGGMAGVLWSMREGWAWAPLAVGLLLVGAGVVAARGFAR